MKILVGKTFGIGNLVLSIPMIKALSVLGEVHLLVGSHPDDFGATFIAEPLLRCGIIKKVCIDGAVDEYDVAVMAIPFDGRWKNGVHFSAKRVVDGRKRPGNVERLGFDMWEKHEVLYQMDNAYELGYVGNVPSSDFLELTHWNVDLVYLGLGYKRDPGGFGLSKHFGNERFAALIQAVRRIRPHTKFVSTGGAADIIQTGVPIMKIIQDDSVYRCDVTGGLGHAFKTMAGCHAYLGNDTGMMHVAASMGKPTHGLFLSQDLVRKNHPWGTKSWMASSLDASVDEIAEYFVKRVLGEE